MLFGMKSYRKLSSGFPRRIAPLPRNHYPVKTRVVGMKTFLTEGHRDLIGTCQVTREILFHANLVNKTGLQISMQKLEKKLSKIQTGNLKEIVKTKV